MYVHAAQLILDGFSLTEALETASISSEIFSYLADIGSKKRNEIRSTGYVKDSLEASFWCLLTTDNFRDALIRAVNLGDDTDTIGNADNPEDTGDIGNLENPEDTSTALTLPILDEINSKVQIGTSGSSLIAVQAAVKLLDWGEHTGLDPEEIREAASAWLSEQTDSDREEALLKLEMVDDAYQRLLKEDARELLDTAGCADTEIFWGSEPVEPVEAIMQAAGLRKD